MPRTTLPTNDLLSLVGAGYAARTPAPGVPSEAPERREPKPLRERVAQRTIKPMEEGRQTPALVPSANEVVATSTRKQKFSARIAADLADAVRDCVVALSGPPIGLTIDAFAEEAFRRETERLRRTHHEGRPFAKRAYNPKPGRRIV